MDPSSMFVDGFIGQFRGDRLDTYTTAYQSLMDPSSMSVDEFTGQIRGDRLDTYTTAYQSLMDPSSMFVDEFTGQIRGSSRCTGKAWGEFEDKYDHVNELSCSILD